MAFPDSGYIKIYPQNVSIISGQWAFNNDIDPQPSRPVGDLQAYFDARTPLMAAAPCITKNVEFPPASGQFIPAVGNYELQFSASTVGYTFHDGSYPSAPVHTTDLIKADFPMGMTISFLTLWINAQILFGPNRNEQIVTIPFNYFGSNFYSYTPGIAGLLNGTQFSPSSGTGSIQGSFLTAWSVVRAGKTFGIEVPVDAVVAPNFGIPRAAFSEVFLLGIYNTQLFRMNPPGLNDGEGNALPGDIVTLENSQQMLENFDPDLFQIYYDDPNSTDPDFPGMTGVFIPRKNIITFTRTILRFRMPVGLGLPYGGKRLMLVGTLTGFLFDGKMPLQNYNITLVNGSGIYNLTPNKRNDTYYDRSGSPPYPTIDLKIPNPRAKTGFVNG